MSEITNSQMYSQILEIRKDMAGLATRSDVQRVHARIDILPCKAHSDEISKTKAIGSIIKFLIPVVITCIGLALTAILSGCISRTYTGLCYGTDKSNEKALTIFANVIEKHFPGKGAEVKKFISGYNIYFATQTRARGKLNRFYTYVQRGSRFTGGSHHLASFQIWISWRGNYSASPYAHELMHAAAAKLLGHPDHKHENEKLWGKDYVKKGYSDGGILLEINKRLSMNGL